jgi:hypothetical protein
MQDIWEGGEKHAIGLYNAKLDEFYREYDLWLVYSAAAEKRARLTIQLDIDILNDGTGSNRSSASDQAWNPW